MEVFPELKDVLPESELNLAFLAVEFSDLLLQFHQVNRAGTAENELRALGLELAHAPLDVAEVLSCDFLSFKNQGCELAGICRMRCCLI